MLGIKKPKLLLIVDDEKSIQYALSALLERYGYVCVVVSNGQEALETVTQIEFDLILLDFRMPGMSGLELLKRFRENNNRTSVVMLTAVAENLLIAESFKLGADDFVLKPCNPEDLSNRLQKAYQRRQSVRNGGPAPGKKQLGFGEAVKGWRQALRAKLKNTPSTGVVQKASRIRPTSMKEDAYE